MWTRRRIAAGIAVALLSTAWVAAAGRPVAADNVGEVLARCQNEDMVARTRIDACSRIATDEKLEPDLRAEALLNRGVAHEDDGLDDAALADYTAAIDLNAEYPAPYGFRGALLDRLGRHEEAVKDLSVVLKTLPDDADTLHSRARSYLILGRAREAAADYGALITLDPKDADAFAGRGSAHEDLGAKAAAIADFNAALALDPENEDAKDGLARLGGR